jgi:leader peptidase (prepilin peptidase)/N-methyltransferase
MHGLAARWPSAAAGIAGALVGGVLGAGLGEPHHVGQSALLGCCMSAIAMEDARRLRVPDSWNMSAALAGLAVAWLGLDAGPGQFEGLAATGLAALQAALCGGAFLLLREAHFRLRGREGLGLGDVKLAATGAIWLGWQLFAVAVLFAASAALVWVAAQSAAGRVWPRHRMIPLGAFLAPAIWASWYVARLMRFG